MELPSIETAVLDAAKHLRNLLGGSATPINCMDVKAGPVHNPPYRDERDRLIYPILYSTCSDFPSITRLSLDTKASSVRLQRSIGKHVVPEHNLSVEEIKEKAEREMDGKRDTP